MVAKQAALEFILQHEPLVRVVFAPLPGVVMPEELRSAVHVHLDVGLNLPVPIGDFVIDERGFRGVFSFARTPTLVEVPWAAVIAITGRDAESGFACFSWEHPAGEAPAPPVPAPRRLRSV